MKMIKMKKKKKILINYCENNVLSLYKKYLK